MGYAHSIRSGFWSPFEFLPLIHPVLDSDIDSDLHAAVTSLP